MFEAHDHVEPGLRRNGRRDGAASRSAAKPLCGAAILIAEDNPHLLATMRRVFLGAGAVVRACDHAEDAAAALTASPESWDLLVTDYEMPQMTGAALARLARLCAPSLPAILCTGLDRGAPELEQAAGLFARILPKPVADSVLIAAAVDAIDAARRE